MPQIQPQCGFLEQGVLSSMIIRCPSCATRFDLPASRFDADGTMIKCSSCGHDWIEGRAIEIAREPIGHLPAVRDTGFEPDHEIRRLVQATREAEEAFAMRRKRRQARLAAWAGLAIASFSPVALALAVPETVVKAAPAAISFYKMLGQDVNVYGLEIRKIEMQHLLVDGKKVVSIKGDIANVSSSSRKIPWLRFGLRDAGSGEVYSWQLDTNARPLNPGEVTSFVTRIASPPETAQTVEIRFARADEIGSNSNP
jgi:predicted Zn finger-like uncharacterized protein